MKTLLVLTCEEGECIWGHLGELVQVQRTRMQLHKPQIDRIQGSTIQESLANQSTEFCNFTN